MQKQLYKIGAVAQRTGLSVERLRAWERRHGVEPAHKVNRTRYYDKDQLERLSLIKELLDQGHSIGHLVELASPELQELLNTRRTAPDAPQLRLVIAGQGVQDMADTDVSEPGEIAQRFCSLDEMESRLDDLPEFDALVLEVPSLDADRIEQIVSVLSVPFVVVYRLASKDDTIEAKERGMRVFKFGNVSWSDLMTELSKSVISKVDHGVGHNLYKDEELYHLSRTRSSGTFAPKDFVDIVLSQRALVDHIQRHTNGAFEVELAGLVRLSTTRMEEALQRVAKEYELFVES
ncbi:MAG: MerR family transcriptional regulator [Gammaproteobacteria bacterium]|nr:MerR family transcriptional regulator [Gammaproteobacteria bacterium]